MPTGAFKMKKLKRVIFTTLILLGTSNVFASNLDIIIKKVLKSLPDKINTEIIPNLKFKVAKLNEQEIDLCKDIATGTTYGSYLKFFNTIKISESVISSYNSCPHKIESKLIETLIHEIFHAYDAKASITKQNNFSCPNRLNHPKRKISVSPRCRKQILQNKRSYIISEDLNFKTITQLDQRQKDNFKGKRVIDAYELESAQEFAAVNFESFILDSEFKCRRPSIYKYFSNHFSYEPFSNKECNHTKKVISQMDSSKIYELDPKRVYQIHYLHADEGQEMISRFGHSMIRIILCAPGREVGPGCLRDIDHHVVLSFRANVNDIKIDMLKGVFGGYPSQLYVIPLKNIIYEYNTTELRNLYSYPLNFSEPEKIAFLERALETYWEYSGDYTFFDNNCAVETYKLITSASDDIKNKMYKSSTPNGILNDLIKTGLIDKKYTSPKNLDRLNVFKSYFYYVQLAYKSLFGKEIEKADFLELIEKDLEMIGDLFLSQDYQGKPIKEQIKTLSAMQLVQKMIIDIKQGQLLKIENNLLAQLAQKNEDTAANLQDYFDFSLLTPIYNSYGIPTQEEVSDVLENSTGNGQQFLSEFDKRFENQLKPIKDEIKIIESILKQITITKNTLKQT